VETPWTAPEQGRNEGPWRNVKKAPPKEKFIKLVEQS